SNFFLEVSGYLVIYDLISNQVKIEPLFEHVTARPGSSGTPSQNIVAALAATDNGLAVLKTNGDLELRDFETRRVVKTLRVAEAVFDEPQRLFVSGPFVAVASHSEISLGDTRSGVVRSVPRDQSVNLTKLSVALSNLGRIAVSQGTSQVDLIDPPVKVSYS